MTTKPPSPIEPFGADTVEKIAYESIAAVPTVEPNDGSRLGYHVWRWLTSREGTLEDAVKESGARIAVPTDTALKSIREHLASKGISTT